MDPDPPKSQAESDRESATPDPPGDHSPVPDPSVTDPGQTTEAESVQSGQPTSNTGEPPVPTNSEAPRRRMIEPVPENQRPPVTTPRSPVRTEQPLLRLPNGSVGKSYDFSGQFAERNPSEGTESAPLITIDRIEGVEQTGLNAVWSEGTLRIWGTPATPGEHELTVAYSLEQNEGDRRALEGRITLTINPDPRSLWKEREPPEDASFRKAHGDHQRLAVPEGLVILGASLRGRSHAHEGLFREDDFQIKHWAKSGWSCLTVADGAGSAALAREGSRVACQTACITLGEKLGSSVEPDFDLLVADYHREPTEQRRSLIRRKLYDALGTAGHQAYYSVDREAKRASRPLKDYSTTLLIALCRRYDFGWFLAGFSIGDGAIAAFAGSPKLSEPDDPYDTIPNPERTTDSGSLSEPDDPFDTIAESEPRPETGIEPTPADPPDQVWLLNRPDSGEFAGQTRFLTMPELWRDGGAILDRIHFEIVPDLTALFAMTDGVSDPKFPTDRDLLDPAAWRALWNELTLEANIDPADDQSGIKLLDWLNFWARGSHDDRTIALLIP